LNGETWKVAEDPTLVKSIQGLLTSIKGQGSLKALKLTTGLKLSA